MPKRTDIIPEGRNYCRWWWLKRPLWKPVAIWVRVYIDESMCTGSYDHISKICGISRGFDHHKHSVRLGWMNTGDHVLVYEYRYDNGKRSKEFLQIAKPGQYVEALMYLDVDGKNVGWRLKSYHGGEQKATTKITVKYEYQVFYNMASAAAFLRLRKQA